MAKINENKWLKLVLRVDYIWLFTIGVALLSIGTACIVYDYKLLQDDTGNSFINYSILIVGLGVVITGFYRKKQYESLINKHKL